MVIDLGACTGCNACVISCQAENNIPTVGREQVLLGREMHWLRIDRYFEGDVDNPTSVHQPMTCLHCENAPCEPVCPVGATVHDEEGINSMAYNRCIGTRYCANNCPFKVRRYNYFDFTVTANVYRDPEQVKRADVYKLQRNPNVTVRYRGVMEKCSYCTQRVEAAKIAFKNAGGDRKQLKDGAVITACQQVCPTGAITFGNINDETSKVHVAKLNDRNYELLQELNIRPRTSYLARLKNNNPELEG
jgi:molybdopterin-containing oxidoreductase family iron-sulfur binding subunit